MMAMMGSISVAMAEGTLGMSPFTILPGEEKTVAVNLNQDGDILSLQADFALPNGLSLVKWQTNAERIDRDAHAVTLTKQADGSYRLTVFPKTLNPIFGNDGALVELTLKADADFTHKGTMDFSNIHLVSTDNNRYDQDNFSVLASPEVGLFSTDVSAITISDNEPRTISLLLDNGVPVYGIEGCIELPEGLSVAQKPNGLYDFKYGSRLPQNASVAFNPDNGRFVLSDITTTAVYGNEGVLFSFDVIADERLAPSAEIKLHDFMISSTGDETFAFPENVITIAVDNTKATLLSPALAQVNELEQLLNNAKVQIEQVAPNTKDSETMQQAITTIETAISNLRTALNDAYNNGTLENDIQGIMQPVEDLKSDIEALVTTAAAEEKAFINNQVYTTLSNQLNELQDAYDKAKEFVESDCKDVADGFAETLNGLQQQIEDLRTDLNTKHDEGTLTADYTIDTEKLTNAIAQLRADAEAAEKAFVNDKMFTDLSAEIEALQTALNDAKRFVDEECKDVAGQFTETIEGLQQQIEALRTDLNTKHEEGALTADSTVETESVYEAIKTLKTDAKAAQDKAIADVYDALTAQLNELQAAYDEVKAFVENDCKDVAADFDETISSLQQQIDGLRTDLNTKHDEGTLTADYTIDTEAITAAIAQLKTDAEAAEKQFISTQVYAVLKKKLDDTNEFYQKVCYYISHECKDVWNNYTSELGSINSEIKGWQQDLENKYAAGALTSDTDYDTERIVTRLEEMKAEATAAQKASVNDQAYARLSKQIEELRTAYETLTAELAGECKDVYGRFTTRFEEVSTAIDALQQTLDEQHRQGELSAESTVDTATLTATLETLAADVRQAQKTFEVNAAQYAVLTKELETVKAEFETAKTTIANDYADVAPSLAVDIQQVEQQISGVAQQIEEAYRQETLTEESTFDFETLRQGIQALLAKAEDLQHASVNDKVFANFSAALQLLQSEINATRTEVAATCPDVAEQFNGRFDALNQAVAGMLQALNEAHDKGSLTADYTLDIESPKAELHQIAVEAQEAQKAFVNDKVYTALSAEIDALDASLQEAVKVIATECPDVADNFTQSLDALKQKVDALRNDLDARHAAGTLTAESTVDTESLKAEINAAVADAKAAQQALKDYQALYAAFEKQVALMRSDIDETESAVAEECPNVAENFAARLADVRTRVDAKAEALKEAYAQGTLTADYMLDFTAEQKELKNILSEARKAQQAYDDNQKAFADLNATIAAVRSKYEDTKAYVESKCSHVASDYAARLEAIADALNAMQQTVDDAMAQGGQAADISLDVKSLSNELDAIREEALNAEKQYQEKAALLADYTQEIAALTEALNATALQIADLYPYIQDIVAEDVENVQNEIDALKDEITLAYEQDRLSTKFWSDLALVKMHIEELLKKAENCNAENEMAYENLIAQLEEVKQVYDTTRETIETECPDVAANYVQPLEDILQQIEEWAHNLEDAYRSGQLLKGEGPESLQPIVDALNALLEEARNAQIAVGIHHITTDNASDTDVFSTNGARYTAPRKGQVNIIRKPDGTVSKVFVK